MGIRPHLRLLFALLLLIHLFLHGEGLQVLDDALVVVLVPVQDPLLLFVHGPDLDSCYFFEHTLALLELDLVFTPEAANARVVL